LGVRLGFLVLCVCVLGGCSGSSSSGGTGNLRFVQASPNAPRVNLLVDGHSVATGLGYINATGYISVRSGSRHVQVEPVSGGSPILDTSVNVVSSGNQTLILTGSAASAHSLLLADGGTTATAGDGNVRVVNASSNAGTADVYMVPAGTSIAGIPATVANLAFNTDTGYQLVPVGAYEVIMTAPGTKNAVLDTGSINLAASANQTVVALDGGSGGVMFTQLTDQ
jgi:hypothetical protein